LLRIGTQFRELEEAVEKAEEERRIADAKVERLRKQKKMWFEKMMRAVRRGLSSVEELERIEREEAEREAERSITGRPSSATSFSQIPDAEWNAVFPEGLTFDPSLLASLGAVDDSPSAAPSNAASSN
jgi:hypothetical protein